MGWVAHVILVSALGPNPSFFLFWGTLFNLGVCWDRGLDLDQGLTISSLASSLAEKHYLYQAAGRRREKNMFYKYLLSSVVVDL